MAKRASLASRLKTRSRNGALPMVAFYGREPDVESKRMEFYAHMARQFGWKEWNMGPVKAREKTSNTPGHGGRKQKTRRVDPRSRVMLNTTSAPLEYMNEHDMLFNAKSEDGGIGMQRFNAGMRLRDLIEGASISTLASPDLGRVGSGGKGIPITDTKLDCMRILERIKQRCRQSAQVFGHVEPGAYSIAEQLCGQDLWIWEYWRSHKREKRIRIIHFALDCVQAEIGELSDQELAKRWELSSDAQPSRQAAPQST